MAPSPMKAVLRSIRACARGSVSIAGGAAKARRSCSLAADRPTTRVPSGRWSKVDRSARKRPFTNTMRWQSGVSRKAVSSGLASAGRGGMATLGNAVRASGPRLVNFHASTFGVGNPFLPKRLIASSRRASSQAKPLPGRLGFASANWRMYGEVDATSTFIVGARDRQSCRRLHQVGVTLGLEFEGQFPATGLDDAPGGQNMHLVWHYVVQEALIMSDKQSRACSPAPCVDAVAHDLERVDVEAGICLVEDGQAGIEQP